jgi:hypothetical protein
MASFTNTINPTPFGLFDSDVDFQADADRMVVFVKTKLSDPILSVELTNKMIWTAFEESVCEYSNQIAQLKIKSELVNLLGMQTGSAGDAINKYPHQTLEFLMRQAEPYAMYAGVGGSYDATMGYVDIVTGQQEYNLYTDLKDFVSGSGVFAGMTTKGKIRIDEVFHLNPIAAQHYLLNASNITNFLAQNFNYESYVNSTIFYVLPVFEDVLRRGMLETSYKVRRSNYSYDIQGRMLRIYPAPMTDIQLGKLFVRVYTEVNPYNPSYQDDSIVGVSGPNNVPFGNLIYATINQPARHWIREFTLANCKEMLGLVRSKFKSIPIPNADLQLNGEELISQSREDKEKLITQLREFFDNLTVDKMLENQALRSDNLMKQLKGVPFAHGGAIGII